MPLDCSGDKLSADCIAQYASRAGFGKDKETLATAVAVALAESSGRIGVSSSTGCCIGLWQINTEVHPYTDAQMRDPQQNANAAWSISNGGTNWKPWDAYKNGSYLLYMPSGNRSASKVATSNNSSEFLEGSILDNIADNGSAINDLIAYPQMVREWLSDRNNITRMAKVALGIALVIGGALLLSRPAVENAVGVVTKSIGPGKLIKR